MKFFLGLIFALQQLGAALFSRFKPQIPTGNLFRNFLPAAGAGFAFAAQLILSRPLGHHGHPCRFNGGFYIFDLTARFIKIC